MCPPPDFATHAFCHEQARKLVINKDKIERRKDTIPGGLYDSVMEWIERLVLLKEVSYTDEEFEEYGQKLLQFNNMAEIILARVEQELMRLME